MCFGGKPIALIKELSLIFYFLFFWVVGGCYLLNKFSILNCCPPRAWRQINEFLLPQELMCAVRLAMRKQACLRPNILSGDLTTNLTGFQTRFLTHSSPLLHSALLFANSFSYNNMPLGPIILHFQWLTLINTKVEFGFLLNFK